MRTLPAPSRLTAHERARGTGKVTARRKASEALARVGLEDQAQKKPGAMSGGQQSTN